jgi:Fic family protein
MALPGCLFKFGMGFLHCDANTRQCMATAVTAYKQSLGFPLSLRLICEAHEKLLASGRGKDQSPGQFRRSQNWIGGSRPGNAGFVPPPADEVLDCMGALEKFLHDDPVKTPPLIKAALARVQFETIHPFLDGNAYDGYLKILAPDE